MHGEQVTAPLFDPATQPPTQNNSAYMKEYVCSEILRSFPNLSRRNVEVFVVGLFDLNKDLASYKAHLRDFLIQSKVHLLPPHSPIGDPQPPLTHEAFCIGLSRSSRTRITRSCTRRSGRPRWRRRTRPSSSGGRRCQDS